MEEERRSKKRLQARSFLLKFDRVLSQGFFSQLGLLLLLMLLAFVVANLLLLLSPTDWMHYCEKQHISRWVAPFYLLIDPNAFTSVYEKGAGHWTVFLACIIYIIGVFLFTGMMVSVITNIIERRVEKHRNGLVHYLKSGHYVIMGYDDTVASFIDYILEREPDAMILLLTSKMPPEVNEKMLKSLTAKQLERLIVNYGHRTSAEEYARIHLESAKEVFIVGYHGQPAHDAINIECIDCICKYLSQSGIVGRPERITCVFRDLDTYNAFKTTEIFSEVGALGIEFIPYNYYTGWARQILSNPEHVYPTLYGPDITPEDRHFLHLVFVGTTNVAVAIATEAAQILHLPNFTVDPSLRTRITFIDLNADKEKDEFIVRYRHFFEVQPYLYRDLTCSGSFQEERDEYVRKGKDSERYVDYDFLDIQFEFIKGDIFSKPVQDLLGEWAGDTKNRYLSIFLALADHKLNFMMSMNMPESVYDFDVPVFVRQDRSDNLVTHLRTESAKKKNLTYASVVDGKLETSPRDGRYSHIYPFGMTKSVYQSDEINLKRAKLINYLYSTADFPTYRFKGLLSLDAMTDEEIWSEAEKYWRPLSVALKWSNIFNALSIDTKCSALRAMRGQQPTDSSRDTSPLSDEEVHVLAQVEHNRWNVEKLLMGFRKPLRSEDIYEEANKEFLADLKNNKGVRLHCDIRPFAHLGPIKELDHEFSRYLPWILKMTGEG